MPELQARSARWRLQPGRMQNAGLGLEMSQFVRRRLDEHVAREQGMPGLFRDDTHAQAMAFVSAGPDILHMQVPALVIRQMCLQDGVEFAGLDRFVDRAPVDIALVAGLAHDELVIGRTACMNTCKADQRATLAQRRLAIGQRHLVKRGRLQIPILFAGINNALRVQPVAADVSSNLRHYTLPRDGKTSTGARPTDPSIEPIAMMAPVRPPLSIMPLLPR